MQTCRMQTISSHMQTSCTGSPSIFTCSPFLTCRPLTCRPSLSHADLSPSDSLLSRPALSLAFLLLSHADFPYAHLTSRFPSRMLTTSYLSTSSPMQTFSPMQTISSHRQTSLLHAFSSHMQ